VAVGGGGGGGVGVGAGVPPPDGGAAGVTALLAAEAALVPTAFVAVTVKV
jgi:hypothetical protein